MIAEILATSWSIRSTANNAGLSIHPKVTNGKFLPCAKGCIHGHVSAGHLFNQDGLHRCWRSLTSGDLLNKPRTWFCLTSEAVSRSVGAMFLRWPLVKDMDSQGGEELGVSSYPLIMSSIWLLVLLCMDVCKDLSVNQGRTRNSGIRP